MTRYVLLSQTSLPAPRNRRAGMLPTAAALVWALTCAPQPALATDTPPTAVKPNKAASQKKVTKARAHHRTLVAQQDAKTAYADRSDAMQFADELVSRDHIDPAWAHRWVGSARLIPVAQKLVAPAPAGVVKNWTAYRARFLDNARIEAGARFWNTYRDTLQRAEQQFGVPAWLVAGIIGVETQYGQNTGSFRVLDVLATLAFDFPSSHPRAAERSAYFRGELRQFLLTAYRNQQSPDDARGSYAGAMGLPQFMPSSLAQFGVDFDGDGKVDLLNSPADAIGSVANYLKSYGWQTGQPTHFPVTLLPTADKETLLAPDILPTFKAADMQAKGVQMPLEAQNYTGKLALIELLNGDPALTGTAPEYYAGSDNFYTVTRYNWSSYYAMAVIELGHAVERRVQESQP